MASVVSSTLPARSATRSVAGWPARRRLIRDASPAFLNTMALPPPLTNQPAPTIQPNAIELAIVAANKDKFAAKPLLQALKEAEVFILTNNPESLRDMLLVRDDSGFLGVAMFTQDFRVEPAIARHPGYEFIATIKFMAVLSCITDGLGFVLNPYSEEVCHRSNPEHAKFLAQHL